MNTKNWVILSVILLVGCSHRNDESPTPTALARELTEDYQTMIWAENRDGEVLYNNTWSIVINRAHTFWRSYEGLEKRIGRTRTKKYLNKLIGEMGVSFGLVVSSGKNHLKDEELKELLEFHSTKTNYFNWRIGDPIDWDKIQYFRNF